MNTWREYYNYYQQFHTQDEKSNKAKNDEKHHDDVENAVNDELEQKGVSFESDTTK